MSALIASLALIDFAFYRFNAGVMVVSNQLRSPQANIKRLALAEMCHIDPVKLGVAEQGLLNPLFSRILPGMGCLGE